MGRGYVYLTACCMGTGDDLQCTPSNLVLCRCRRHHCTHSASTHSYFSSFPLVCLLLGFPTTTPPPPTQPSALQILLLFLLKAGVPDPRCCSFSVLSAVLWRTRPGLRLWTCGTACASRSPHVPVHPAMKCLDPTITAYSCCACRLTSAVLPCCMLVVCLLFFILFLVQTLR